MSRILNLGPKLGPVRTGEERLSMTATGPVEMEKAIAMVTAQLVAGNTTADPVKTLVVTPDNYLAMPNSNLETRWACGDLLTIPRKLGMWLMEVQAIFILHPSGFAGYRGARHLGARDDSYTLMRELPGVLIADVRSIGRGDIHEFSHAYRSAVKISYTHHQDGGVSSSPTQLYHEEIKDAQEA